MPSELLGVLGICPKADSILPAGIHLRWSFPREMGFPGKGFTIFRRRSGLKPKYRGVSFGALRLNEPVPSNLTIDGVRFVLSPPTTQLVCRAGTGGARFLEIDPAVAGALELRFNDPVVHVQVEIQTVTAPSVLRAYYGNRLVAASATTGSGSRAVTAPAIDRVVLELGFARLVNVNYATVRDLSSDASWGVPIAQLPLPANASQALALLGTDLRNFYAADANAAVRRYERRASDMVAWLQLLQSPGSNVFLNPGQPPPLLRMGADQGTGVSAVVQPQSVLLLAALDPNIARMLCLYWTDRFTAVGEPRRGTTYDYKVEGAWKNGDTRDGLLFDVGGADAELPSIAPELKGRQFPGYRWRSREPVARVGLRWPRAPAVLSAPVRAVQPVAYDIRRAGRRLQLAIVSAAAWTDAGAPLFIDRDVPLGEHAYEVRGVDLFGQVGIPLVGKTQVRDIGAPPAPVRVRATIDQSDPGAVVLHAQFEFGAFQHQQAADVHAFKAYWRPDTLFRATPVTIEPRSRQRRGTRYRHTVRVRQRNGATLPAHLLTRLAGDVLTNALAAPPRAAAERRRYRLLETAPPDTAVVETADGLLEGGPHHVVHDTRDRADWTELAGVEIKWREPITGDVRRSEDGMAVEIVSLRTISPSPDPFSSVPETLRRSLPDPAPIPALLEASLAVDLIEPDVFTRSSAPRSSTGTAATPGGSIFELVYAVSGGGSSAGARVGLPTSAPVHAGGVLTLMPPPEIRDRVRYVTIAGTIDDERRAIPGGEIAWEEKRGEDVITHVGRVISSAVNGTGTFSVLVRFGSAEAADLVRNATRVRFYAPYRIRLPVSVRDGVDAPLTLPVAANAGARTAYVAFNALDKRAHESPLGTPAQVSVYKLPPEGAPGRPYPCPSGPAAGAGYATPPDRLGRATVCIRWDAGDTSPAAGLRWEVARALDSAIVAAHLRNWHLGKPEAEVQPPVAGVDGTLSNVRFDAVQGLYRATFAPSGPVAQPHPFRQGRLSRNARFFEITLAAPSSGTLDLLLRAPNGDAPTGGAARIEAPPDYSAIRNDHAMMRELAAANPDAFGIVTGMPVPQMEFTDEIAGIGRNCFFYRVRAVDGAENRSSWSPISVPIHQVDTTPPVPPGPLQLVAGDRSVTLVWPLTSESGVAKFLLYRAEGANVPDDISSVAPFREIALGDTTPAPLFVVAGAVSFPQPVVFTLPSGTSEGDAGSVVGGQVTVRRISGDPGNLFDAASSRVVHRAERAPSGELRVVVLGVADLLEVEQGTAVRVHVGSTEIAATTGRVSWVDTAVAGGMAYEYRLVAVKHVTAAPPGPGLPERLIEVPSRPGAAARVVSVDYSDPPPPHIAAIEWVDSSGQPATASEDHVFAKVTVSSSPHTASVLVQRQAAGEVIRVNAPIDGERGWKAWPADATQMDLLDAAAAPTVDWTYTVTIRMRDGRTGASDPVTRVRLR